MGRKKKLKEKDFLKILKTNSKENPFDIDKYDKQSIIDCRKNYIRKRVDFYVTFHCLYCDRLVIKNINRQEKLNLDAISFCQWCYASNTTFLHYGVRHPAQSKKIYSKMEKTNLERYNSKSPYAYGSQNFKNLMLEKYNTLIPQEIEGVNEKIKQTRLLRYGCYSINKKYCYNSIFFDSSWELAFYIYHTDKGHKIKHEPCNFSYTYKNIEHLYFPDFKVNNKYYEIKGEQFIERYKNGNIKTLMCSFDHSLDKLYNAKYKCMKKHNVTIIDCNKIQKYLEYIIDTYGEDYLDQFRVE